MSWAGKVIAGGRTAQSDISRVVELPAVRHTFSRYGNMTLGQEASHQI
jgi:hypothetical protein